RTDVSEDRAAEAGAPSGIGAATGGPVVRERRIHQPDPAGIVEDGAPHARAATAEISRTGALPAAEAARCACRAAAATAAETTGSGRRTAATAEPAGQPDAHAAVVIAVAAAAEPACGAVPAIRAAPRRIPRGLPHAAAAERPACAGRAALGDVADQRAVVHHQLPAIEDRAARAHGRTTAIAAAADGPPVAQGQADQFQPAIAGDVEQAEAGGTGIARDHHAPGEPVGHGVDGDGAVADEEG